MGNMSGSYGSHYTLWQSVTTNWQDVGGNYTNVTVRMYLTFDGSSYYAYTNNSTSGSMTINGGKTDYSIASINFSSGQKKDILLAEWTGNIGHNSDGTKTLEVSGDWNTNTSRIGSGSTSSSITLTKINRYPNFTTNPYIVSRGLDNLTFNYGAVDIASSLYYSFDNYNWTPIYNQNTTIYGLTPNTGYTIYVQAKNQQDNSLSTTRSFQTSTLDIAKMTYAPNINIGDNAYISWTNPSGATIGYFVEVIYYDSNNEFHFDTVRDVTYVTGKSSETIVFTQVELDKIYKRIPDSNVANLRYGIRTFYSNTHDSDFVDRTGTVVNKNPIFNNFEYQDTDSTILGLTDNPSILVKGYSDVVVTISDANKAQGQNYASIDWYKVSIAGNESKTFASNVNTSETLYNVVSNVIDVFATDSRGNSTKVSKTVEMKNYFAPQIQFLSATRENGIGEKITLNFTINFWNENFGKVQNTLKSLVYKYKTTWANEYINGSATLNYNTNGNTVTGSMELPETFQLNDTYNIQLFTNDELNSSNVVVTISAGNPALAIYKNRLAIGGKYDEAYDDPLQVNGKARFVHKDGHIFQIGENEIYWKENWYGDKFKILPDFNAEGDSNRLKIMASTGGAGEDPELYDIFYITGLSGNAFFKGTITSANLNDTGWVDLSANINTSYFSIRNGLPPKVRKINNIVYWIGELYCHADVPNSTEVLLFNIPTQFRPKEQHSGSGVPYLTSNPYTIYTDSWGKIRIGQGSNITVQNEWQGYQLSNLSGYLGDYEW